VRRRAIRAAPHEKVLRLGRGLWGQRAKQVRLLELDLLAELDRRHSVTVKMVTPVPSHLDPGPRLRAANSLAAEGITTILLLAPAAEPSGRIEEELRFLLEKAREAEVHDVEIETAPLRRADRADLRSIFERLRLEHGFPRGYAGRG